eukprot:9212493-Pyramimonas_sp.AAC.1
MIGASRGGAGPPPDFPVIRWRHPWGSRAGATAPRRDARSHILGPCKTRMCHHFREPLGGHSERCPRDGYQVAHATTRCCVQPAASPGGERR